MLHGVDIKAQGFKNGYGKVTDNSWTNNKTNGARNRTKKSIEIHKAPSQSKSITIHSPEASVWQNQFFDLWTVWKLPIALLEIDRFLKIWSRPGPDSNTGTLIIQQGTSYDDHFTTGSNADRVLGKAYSQLVQPLASTWDNGVNHVWALSFK